MLLSGTSGFFLKLFYLHFCYLAWTFLFHIIYSFLFVCFSFFLETGFLCSPSCPGTCYVNQACLELRDLSAFAS